MAFMRLPLLFLMIFSASGLYAQLYISPSGNSDSYFYAKDRVIYVENEIHLKANHKKETEASIYLRKQSQLLQGPKLANLNKGDGKLSVFQTGTSNAYDYNYWGLPVKVNVAANHLNDYIFEPITPTESRKAKLISALEGSSNPLSISDQWIYAYSGTNYSDWQYLGDDFDLLPGEGFTMKGVNGVNPDIIEGQSVNSGSAQVYDFRGIPNDGRIELPIKKDQIILVGNPYPSAIDLDKFLFENTNTTGIAYFWDSKKNGNSHYLSDYEGGYGTYSPGTGVYLPPIFKKYSNGAETGEKGDYYPRKMSPIAQGFMVMGKTEGKVIFQNSQRIYQKEAAGISQLKSPETSSYLKLNIELDTTYIRQLVLAFNKNATPDEDFAMDARKMDQNPSDISWLISNEDYLIDARPRIDGDLIPLHISLNRESDLKFSLEELNNFNPDRLFIYDSKDDLYFSIKTGYYKIKLPPGDYKDRFFLSFIEKLPAGTPTTDNLTTDQSSFKQPNILLNTIDIFQNNIQQQLEIKILYDSGIRDISLYDLNGKLFFSKNFRSKEKEFSLPTENLSNAVYIVKVITSDNRELTKKIGVKN